MSKFTIHNLETAPDKSKPLLEASQKAYHMIPNLHGVMAEAPSLLAGYQQIGKLFEQTSFNAEELTVVWQTVNVEHECHYCVPAHTGIAHSMKVDPALSEALRNREPMPNDKLQALQDTVLILVRNRGHITDEEVQRFYDAGYAQQQLLEIILGIAMKVMSNYTNHVADTPVDKPFQQFAWDPKG